MSRRAKREEEKVKSKIFSKIIVVAIFLGLVFFVLKVAPNYRTTCLLYTSWVEQQYLPDKMVGTKYLGEI